MSNDNHEPVGKKEADASPKASPPTVTFKCKFCKREHRVLREKFDRGVYAQWIDEIVLVENGGKHVESK